MGLNAEHTHQLSCPLLTLFFLEPAQESDYLFLKVVVFLKGAYDVHEVQLCHDEWLLGSLLLVLGARLQKGQDLPS